MSDMTDRLRGMVNDTNIPMGARQALAVAATQRLALHTRIDELEAKLDAIYHAMHDDPSEPDSAVVDRIDAILDGRAGR